MVFIGLTTFFKLYPNLGQEFENTKHHQLTNSKEHNLCWRPEIYTCIYVCM